MSYKLTALLVLGKRPRKIARLLLIKRNKNKYPLRTQMLVHRQSNKGVPPSHMLCRFSCEILYYPQILNCGAINQKPSHMTSSYFSPPPSSTTLQSWQGVGDSDSLQDSINKAIRIGKQFSIAEAPRSFPGLLHSFGNIIELGELLQKALMNRFASTTNGPKILLCLFVCRSIAYCFVCPHPIVALRRHDSELGRWTIEAQRHYVYIFDFGIYQRVRTVSVAMINGVVGGKNSIIADRNE